MKSILDNGFRYIPSIETDLRKTFARIRREQAKAEQAKRQADIDALHEEALLENATFDAAREASEKVRPLTRRNAQR